MKYNKRKSVYLVGAGPGDPDLLTVKAKRLLTTCDALVYDSLIPTGILKLAPASCKRYFVGKRCGNHSLTQNQINELLIDIAKENFCVVRLKGGDPFMFGRGSEEAKYLVENKINVEVVPGITSGIAAPAYVGIPVTHREAGSSVTFVTGHEDKKKLNPSVNWRALAKATDGIVIYMGMHNLSYIIKELLEGGRNANTPVVIIQQGTLLSQRYIKSSLIKLLEEKNPDIIVSPSIIIIGEVINYQVEECSPETSTINISKINDLMRVF